VRDVVSGLAGPTAKPHVHSFIERKLSFPHSGRSLKDRLD
jgi:hypothetical protein